MTFLGVCKGTFFIAIAFLYVLYSYVLGNVSIDQFSPLGTYEQTREEHMGRLHTKYIFNRKIIENSFTHLERLPCDLPSARGT